MKVINNSGILSLRDDKMSASTFAFTEENNRQPLFNYGNMPLIPSQAMEPNRL